MAEYYSKHTGLAIDNAIDAVSALRTDVNALQDAVDEIQGSGLSGDYLPLSGGRISGKVTIDGVEGSDPLVVRAIRGSNGMGGTGDLFLNYTGGNVYLGKNGLSYVDESGSIYGAVWNDYAEYRDQITDIPPGYCVASLNDGRVYKTTERLEACDGIVSDTFGFTIGKTNKCKTPLAVAGRVLAYCEGSKYDYTAGDTVCAGPEGKVSKMTREEIREWPDRIVGIVSEIPEYKTWGTGNIKVDNRIWIKVK